MKQAWIIVLFCLLGAALQIYLFYPGGCEADLQVTFAQAEGRNEFDDRHPPIITAVWKLLLHIVPGQLGFFFLDILCFWMALCLVSLWWLPKVGKLAWIFLGIGLWPPLMIQYGALVKDLQHLSAVFLAFGWFLWALEKRSAYLFVLALGPLCYAAWAKKNGIITVWPLCIWSVQVLSQIYSTKIRAAFVLGTVLTGMIWGIGQFLENSVLQATKTYPQQIVWGYDLVGASVKAQKVLVPSELGNFSLPELTRLYSDLWGVRVYYNDYLPESMDPDTSQAPPLPLEPEVSRRFPYFQNERERNLLREAWIHAWLNEPWAILSHKMAVFKHMLGIDLSHVCEPYHDSYWKFGDCSSVVGLRPGTLRFSLNRWVTRNIYQVRNSLLFRSWIYLIVLGALCVYVWKKRNPWSSPFLYFTTAALIYTSSYFMASAGCVFRYSLLVVLATLLMLATAICIKFGAKNSPVP